MRETGDRPAGAPMARIAVRLKGALAGRFPGGRTTVEVEAGERVGRLVELLDLPRSSYIFVVNGAAVGPAHPMRDGDRVDVYPPMAGGCESRRGTGRPRIAQPHAWRRA